MILFFVLKAKIMKKQIFAFSLSRQRSLLMLLNSQRLQKIIFSQYNIEFQMATIFGGSRLANLREKRTSGDQGLIKREQQLKLSLPEQETQKGGYQPSFNMNRTNTRLLKGRIDRPSYEPTENRAQNENNFTSTSESAFKLKLSTGGQTEKLRLVINDETKVEERKNSVDTNPMRTTQKRILIAKQPEKQKVIEKQAEKIEQPPKYIVPDVVPEKPSVLSNQEKPIREEEVEESMQAGENDLIECPEGCGRKFNKKALQKHAKACKLVFMSKRKQFNSQAKRLVTKQQANIIKQVKAKEKKEGKGKTKGFQKTTDNWKAASEDFRAAIKAIKKDNVDQQQKEEQGDVDKEEEMKIVFCKFCQKPFAQVFMDKHLEGCVKKKEGEKKKTTIKKK